MDMNESIRNDTSEDVIELGVASAETKGSIGVGNEELGFDPAPGISEE